MPTLPPLISPHREAAVAALEDFLPRAAGDYAANRNYDHGPDRRGNVSGLSPWIRVRQLTEWEVVAAVLARHGAKEASKFIDEVCWRTYWKGWLQLRPSVWTDYLKRVRELKESGQHDLGVRLAMEGRTGIDCFDTWAQELAATGYLHNHTRMWVASIWIHTLKLPWELGADWFLQHLLDGDPASNTLSWRWVAGLHTAGKTYLAGRGNIRRYTDERFEVTGKLASEPVDVPIEDRIAPKPISPEDDLADVVEAAVLLTDDDLSAAGWIGKKVRVVETAGFDLSDAYAAAGMSSGVVQFRREALASRSPRVISDSTELLEWLRSLETKVLIMAEPPVGIGTAVLDEVRRNSANLGIELRVVRHAWDDHFWPRATHGFFRFKQAIPEALERLPDWTR